MLFAVIFVIKNLEGNIWKYVPIAPPLKSAN